MLGYTLLLANYLSAQAPFSQSAVPKRVPILPSKHSAELPSGNFERHLTESNIESNTRGYAEAKMWEWGRV